MKVKELQGQRFGRLVVLGRAPDRKKEPGRARWDCTCDCGNPHEASGTELRSGQVKSCGCFRRDFMHEAATLRNTTHGASGPNIAPEYHTWRSMLQRCLNSKAQAYEGYGGRGICVCEAWQRDFESFFRDMGPRPSEKHSLDRIDNRQGYHPDNCRWADKATQTRNTRVRKTNKTGVKGVFFQHGRYEVSITVNYKKIHVGCYRTLQDATAARRAAEALHWGGGAR